MEYKIAEQSTMNKIRIRKDDHLLLNSFVCTNKYNVMMTKSELMIIDVSREFIKQYEVRQAKKNKNNLIFR